jgi:hypothetical protein
MLMLKNSIYRRLIFLSLTYVLYTSVYGMNVVRPFKFFFNPSPHYGTRWQLFAHRNMDLKHEDIILQVVVSMLLTYGTHVKTLLPC